MLGLALSFDLTRVLSITNKYAQQHPFSALFNNCHAVMSEVRSIEGKLQDVTTV